MRITLNVAASPTDKTYANQLKGAAILEPIFKRQPRHPGVVALSDPPLRLPADRREGARCGQALCRDRAGGAARAAHAVAHLHARRLLEGVDRLQHRVGESRQGRQGRERSTARPGLHGLRLSAARAGQQCACGHRRYGGSARNFNPDIMGAPYALAASPARYAIERGDWKGCRGTARCGRCKFAHVEAITHFARALGAARIRQSGGGQGGRRQACGTARQAARGKGCLLVGARRHPVAGGECLAALRRGQARRRAQGHERRGRCRGQDREGAGDAGARSCRRASSTARCCSSAAWPRRRWRLSRRR